MNENDIKNIINEQFHIYTKSQRKLAVYFIENMTQAAFLSAKQVGDILQVSEATVLRFSKQAGYKSYSQFKMALGMSSLAPTKKEAACPNMQQGEEKSGVLERIFHQDIYNIQQTQNNMDDKIFQAAIQMLIQANRVYVIGLRNSKPLATYFAHYLNYLLKDVKVLTAVGSEEILEQMYRITNKDLVFGISFPRYSVRTLKALEFANQRNAKVITLTDHINSPISLYSSCNLLAQSSTSYVIESLTAPFSLLHALLVGICEQKQDEIKISMKQIEKLWDDYKVFGNDNMEYIDK